MGPGARHPPLPGGSRGAPGGSWGAPGARCCPVAAPVAGHGHRRGPERPRSIPGVTVRRPRAPHGAGRGRGSELLAPGPNRAPGPHPPSGPGREPGPHRAPGPCPAPSPGWWQGRRGAGTPSHRGRVLDPVLDGGREVLSDPPGAGPVPSTALRSSRRPPESCRFSP